MQGFYSPSPSMKCGISRTCFSIRLSPEQLCWAVQRQYAAICWLVVSSTKQKWNKLSDALYSLPVQLLLPTDWWSDTELALPAPADGVFPSQQAQFFATSHLLLLTFAQQCVSKRTLPGAKTTQLLHVVCARFVHISCIRLWVYLASSWCDSY